jgi:hypothetical protein
MKSKFEDQQEWLYSKTVEAITKYRAAHGPVRAKLRKELEELEQRSAALVREIDMDMALLMQRLEKEFEDEG